MSKKAKTDTGKGKGKKVNNDAETGVGVEEKVTELEKEMLEWELKEIEKKLKRLEEREEELKSGTREVEQQMEEYKREKGAVIEEQEHLLAEKESEKVKKRDEMVYLRAEIGARVEQHKKRIQDAEQKFNCMVTELGDEIAKLEGEVRTLEEYKEKKGGCEGELEEIERRMEEAEMQQQRNLFEVERKWELAKVRVKKELQWRLLQLSIEFRETSQKRIGKPCHRATQENKAIENVLGRMQEEIWEYREKSEMSKETMRILREEKDKKAEEREKMVGRVGMQRWVIKNLKKERIEALEKFKKWEAVDAENKALFKRYKAVTGEIEKRSGSIEETRDRMERKVEETVATKEAGKRMKKTWRKVGAAVRNARKVAEEAVAVRVIPVGGLEEERFLTTEAKIRLFRKRRDAAFAKKGKILGYLLEVLCKGRVGEDEKGGRGWSQEESVTKSLSFLEKSGGGDGGGKEAEEKKERERGPMLYTSVSSLPRSVSGGLAMAREKEEEAESQEGEMELFGEEEEEKEVGEEAEEEEPPGGSEQEKLARGESEQE